MILATTAVCMLTACGGLGTGMGNSTNSGNGSGTGSVLGGIIGAITNGEGIGNAITSVLGFDKVTAKGLVGAWRYAGPGCAFTSENMLAKAGGEMAAVQVKEKLKSQFDALGFTASNTSVTFTEDGKFAAKIGGRSWSGTWTLDESTGAITLKGLILSIKGYTKRSVTGISCSSNPRNCCPSSRLLQPSAATLPYRLSVTCRRTTTAFDLVLSSPNNDYIVKLI